LIAVRALLADPSRNTRRGRKQRHLLSGIALCGGPMASDPEKCCGGAIMANAGDYYRCGSGRNGTPRPEAVQHVYRKRSELDEYVRELAIARLAREDARDLLVPSEKSSEDNPQELQKQIRKLRAREKELAEAFAEGEITRAQQAAASKKLRTQREDLESRAAVAAHSTRASLVPEMSAAEVAATADEAREVAEQVWDSLSIERQRDVVRHLMTVTVLPSNRRGRNPFKTSDVKVEWRS
jgi:hypothetical protein